jgi:hypothetical protein
MAIFWELFYTSYATYVLAYGVGKICAVVHHTAGNPYPSMALDLVSSQGHLPAALTPGKTSYLLYGNLGRHQGRSGRVRNISPPPEFDPLTVQPVASRYTY